MATIINADNGVVSGVPGLKYVSDSTGNLQLQTNGTNALLVDTSQYPSATVNGLGTGRIPAEQFYCLQTALVGTQATTVQPMLGVGVTLVGNTVYQCEYFFTLTKSAGTTSHTVAVYFGGTATLNNFSTWVNYVYAATGALPQGSASAAVGSYNGVTGIAGTGAITTAVTSYFVRGTAIVSVNAGGTFIPQYLLSAAPGGAYSTAIGSYLKISPLGASGSNTSIGTWS
jgi:hypothetical protein